MKVLILGASGRTGRLVVEEARAAGHEVTAFTRDQADLGATVRVVTGDTTDPAAVERAMAGQEKTVLGQALVVANR